MASIYDIAGTSCQSFTIGNGITIMYGENPPLVQNGKVGDIYVQTHITTEVNDIVNKTLLGRVYIKNIKNNKESWDYIKNYSFDTPIISEIETELNSNDFLISIQQANNSNIKTATAETDFNENHSSYGVTRYATDSEVIIDTVSELSTPTDKIISMTPSQIAHNLKVESDRAISVEGKLSDLNSNLTNTNLVAALNSEYSARTSKDNSLQSQIDAINARKDIVDIVPDVDSLLTYNTATLTNEDIIKVLDNKLDNNKQSYYRYTKDQSKYGDDKDIQISGSEYFWDWVGSESTSYTKAEAEEKFVEIEGSETITGSKTFTQTITSEKNGVIIDVKNPSSNQSVSNLISNSTETENSVSLLIADDNGVEVGSLNLVHDKTTSKSYVSSPTYEASSDSNSNIVATIGWVNDPTKSTNVVHRSGDESIDGSKTFTSSPTVPTPSSDDSSTKVATTEFVKNTFGNKQDKIVITNSDYNKVFATDDKGDTYWRTVSDITTIEGLADVDIDNSKENGQTIVYDSEQQKWVNGLQTVATIKYW